MSLQDTEKKLYDSNSDINKREHSRSEFDLEEASEDKIYFTEKKSGWNKFYYDWFDNDRRIAIFSGLVVLGVVIFLVLGFVVLNKFKQTAFSESKVNITVEGPDVVNSAEETKYVIKYKNGNRVALKNVEINLNHSENFYPDKNEKMQIENERNIKINLGELRAFDSGEIIVTGKFYAAENYMVYLQPTLKYKAQNFNSFFEATHQFGVRVSSSPVELSVVVPKEALDESTIDYEIIYQNKGSVDLENINIKAEYSEGLIFQEAEPAPIIDNNIWYLGSLKRGQRGVIKLKSKIDGQQYDSKLISASIYKNESNGKEVVYGKFEEIVKVVIPPLAIDLRVNGKNSINIDLGKNLNYKITYSNRGNIGFKDVIIKLKIDSPVIDYAKLRADKGTYDSSTKDFTWKVSDLRNLSKLEPGENGQIEINIPLKEKINITSSQDKNYTIEAVATIDSSDVAYHSLGNSKNITSSVLAKLNSKIVFENLINYEDNDIKNYGPNPPQVGQETTYAVNWKVRNVSNTVSDLKVYAIIPTWLKWKGTIIPQGENISFNERTNEMTWNIGTMESGTGFLSNPKEIKFQLGMTPEINQNQNDLKITQDIKITGKDTFTEENIEIIKNL